MPPNPLPFLDSSPPRFHAPPTQLRIPTLWPAWPVSLHHPHRLQRASQSSPYPRTHHSSAVKAYGTSSPTTPRPYISQRFKEDSQYCDLDDDISLFLRSSERIEGSKRDDSEAKSRWSWMMGRLPWERAKARGK